MQSNSRKYSFKVNNVVYNFQQIIRILAKLDLINSAANKEHFWLISQFHTKFAQNTKAVS